MLGSRALWHKFSFSIGNATTRARAVSLLPLTLLAALPMSTILQTPNPVDAFKVIGNPPAGVGIVWPSTAGLQLAYSALRKGLPPGQRTPLSVAYYGQWGNYVTLATGVPSLAIGDTPPVDGTLPTGADCQYLAHQKTQILIVDSPTVAQYGASICGIFQHTTTTLYNTWVVYRRS